LIFGNLFDYGDHFAEENQVKHYPLKLKSENRMEAHENLFIQMFCHCDTRRKCLTPGAGPDATIAGWPSAG
jgi:hypothetical protein